MKKKSLIGAVLDGIASAAANNEKELNRAAGTGLKLLTTKILSVLPDGFPEVERKRLEKQVHGELSSAYDVIRIKVTRRAKNQPIALDRLQVIAACDTLSIPRPKIGKPVDLARAKRHRNQNARAYHPDANSGNEKNRNELEAALKAYDVLEAYNESLTKAAPSTPQSEPTKEP